MLECSWEENYRVVKLRQKTSVFFSHVSLKDVRNVVNMSPYNVMILRRVWPFWRLFVSFFNCRVK
jgi:hypothetical protein